MVAIIKPPDGWRQIATRWLVNHGFMGDGLNFLPWIGMGIGIEIEIAIGSAGEMSSGARRMTSVLSMG